VPTPPSPTPGSHSLQHMHSQPILQSQTTAQPAAGAGSFSPRPSSVRMLERVAGSPGLGTAPLPSGRPPSARPHSGTNPTGYTGSRPSSPGFVPHSPTPRSPNQFATLLSGGAVGSQASLHSHGRGTTPVYPMRVGTSSPRPYSSASAVPVPPPGRTPRPESSASRHRSRAGSTTSTSAPHQPSSAPASARPPLQSHPSASRLSVASVASARSLRMEGKYGRYDPAGYEDPAFYEGAMMEGESRRIPVRPMSRSPSPSRSHHGHGGGRPRSALSARSGFSGAFS
jgi:hypothetical protein